MPLESRKHWLFGPPTAGAITIDDGALKAIIQRGRSLLPKGILPMLGDFSRGIVVRIRSTDGRDIAHGVRRYNSDALRMIAGQHSQDISDILGYEYGHVVIHLADLILC